MSIYTRCSGKTAATFRRERCGGGKGSAPKPDKNLGIAARATAATADRALDWSMDYYKTVITPMLQQQNEAANKAQDQLGDLYGKNAEQMQFGIDSYKKYGMPAEAKYHDMVKQYSSADEEERQAQLAKGDLGMAQASQQQQFIQKMSGLGIDPTSPAATSAMSDMAVQNTAAQAAGMNRARQAAKTLGMQLTSDAANFGRGGQSAISQFGQNASGNASGAFGVANQALGGTVGASSGVQQGFGQAIQGHAAVTSAYAQTSAAQIQAQAQEQAAMWGGLGSMVGLGAGLVMKSDRRLKENLVRIGELTSGVGVYAFNYIGDIARKVGVVAQEVLHIKPEAVIVGDDGYYMVDYGMLS